MLAKASYGPYARAMVRICKEENFHKRQGYEIMATLAAGTPAQRAMAQDAVNRWWWPSLMMFGPPDSESSNSDELLRWGVKKKSNDELRQRFVNLTVAQAKAIDLTLPDPDLAYDDDDGELEVRPDRLGRVLARREGRRTVQSRASRGAQQGARRRRVGPRRRGGVRREAKQSRPKPLDEAARRSVRTAGRLASGRCGKCSCSRRRASRTSTPGSVHAATAEQALQNARDVYARRGEAVSIWVVPSAAITASTPEDMGPFFDPGNDKPYRHPQFYKVPRGVRVF